MMTDWIENEVMSASLGDGRLNKRLNSLLENLSSSPAKSIYGSSRCTSDAISAYRFFDNEKVSPETILSGHYAATVSRAKQESYVLVAQDTTIFNNSRLDAAIEESSLTNEVRDEIPLHMSVVFGEKRDNLGIIKATFHKDFVRKRRNEKQIKSAVLKDSENKSHRWIEHYQAACEFQSQVGDTAVITIADRECDFYDYHHFVQSQPIDERAESIVRGCQLKRRVEDKDDEEIVSHLSEVMDSACDKGSFEVELPKRGNKPARKTTLTIKFETVTFRSKKEPSKSPVTLTVVQAYEKNTTEKNPIHWMLLTTMAVETTEQAQTIVGWYGQRWEIEIYFRVLKQCCKIKEIKLRNYHRLSNALAVYCIVAWKIHLITMNARRYPDAPASLSFNQQELATIIAYLKGRNQYSNCSMREITRGLAKMGGYKGRKNDREPGVKVIAYGFEKLMAFFEIQDFIAQKCV